MKNDTILYERIYQIIKSRIISGLLPKGSKLPSRASLCKEFNTSEKTIRSALNKLVQEGLIETSQRKRPVVTLDSPVVDEEMPDGLQEVSPSLADDIALAGYLYCYPIIEHGIALCTREDLKYPKAIVEQMDPSDMKKLWLLSNQFWRFFIARNGNELILHTIGSTGFQCISPTNSTDESRLQYKKELLKIIETRHSSGFPSFQDFNKAFSFYGMRSMGKWNLLNNQMPPDFSLHVGLKGMDSQLQRTQEKYSAVYLDLLGLIATGRYQLGDRLPSHSELCQIYGVSADTINRAMKILRKWGVVKTEQGKGSFVAMDLYELKKIPIHPEEVASHIRRFLDSVELLSLTIENVAANAVKDIVEDDAKWLYWEIDCLWNDRLMYIQTPYVILKFIINHLNCKTLKKIYYIALRDYCIAKCIPKLVDKTKTPGDIEICRLCREATIYLLKGESDLFVEKVAEIFENIRRHSISECKRLGYYDAAMKVYDGTTLWKPKI